MSALQIDTPEAFEPLLNPSRYRAAYGGRGSGKSHFFAELLVEECIVVPGTHAVCIREVQKTLNQSVKRLIENKIKALGVESMFEVQESKILTPGNGQIIFMGMQNHNADSIKSLEDYRIAWVEEAQSLSQKSLDMLRPTLRAEGSELWFSWNPNLETDPVDQLLRGKNPPPGANVIQVNWDANPWFPDVLREEMEYDRRRDPDKFLHIWQGDYVRNSEARVFKNWTVEEFDTKVGATFRLGADWGFAVDPSVLVRCYVEGRTIFIDHEAYMVGCEIDQLPDLFDRVPDSRKWFITADSSRPETISYMRRNGYPKINPATKGPNSVDEGVEFLKSYDIVVHPRCRHVIDELTLYSYKVDKLTEQVLPVLEDKNNHCIDALRYALEGIRKRNQTERKAKPVERQYYGASNWMSL